MKGKEKFALDGSSIIVIYFKGPFINILDSPSERVLLSSSSASLVLPFSPDFAGVRKDIWFSEVHVSKSPSQCHSTKWLTLPGRKCESLKMAFRSFFF